MAKRKRSTTHVDAGKAEQLSARPATRSRKAFAPPPPPPPPPVPHPRSRPSRSRSARQPVRKTTVKVKVESTDSDTTATATPTTTTDTTTNTTTDTTVTTNQPRRIMTRSRARIFRFMDLPPEIRNLVYDFAFAQNAPVLLSELRLPTSLRTSRSIYTEARQYFFLNTPVTVHVRCNWCMRYHHLHLENHTRFDETGLVREAPAMLQRDSTLAMRVARFQTVDLRIECCCCEQAKQVGSAIIHVRNKQPEMELPNISNLGHPCRRVAAGLERMFDNAREVLACIGRLPTFNGLSMSDLDWLAGCFQEIPDGSSSSEDSHD